MRTKKTQEKRQGSNERRKMTIMRRMVVTMTVAVMVAVMTMATPFESLDRAIPKCSSLAFYFHKNLSVSLFYLS